MHSVDEHDKDRIPLRIVFCLPGDNFSGRFLECWSNTLAWCFANNIQPIISRKYSCNIYYVRNMCLGGDVMRGKTQKPFDGKLDYDFLMWIDSDILWDPNQIGALLNHNADIVSGIYKMEDGVQYAAVKDWDEEYFKQHGSFKFLTDEDITVSAGNRGNPDNPVNRVLGVVFTGFGFTLIKRGIIDKMEYPWFRPVFMEIGNAFDFCMEDVGFCLQAKEKGIKILVDPLVRVGHEKKTIL